MGHCNKVGGGNHNKVGGGNHNKVGGGNHNKVGGTGCTRKRRRQMKGGSSNMAGSPYQGESPVVQQGSPFVGFDLKGDTSLVSGSYAPLQKGVHQCGGRRRSQRKQQQRRRRTQRSQQQRRKGQKQQQRRRRSQKRRN